MAESGSVAWYLNEFKAVTSQLESVEINFEDEIRALILPEALDDLVMAVSNSYETGTLKFDDVVGILLSEEACKKSSGSTETSEKVP